MANPVVRYWPIYWNGKKVAEAFDNSLGINPNRTEVYGAEGFFTLTQGAVTSDINIQAITPVAGTSIDFILQTVLQQDVDLGCVVAGKQVLVTMGITSCNLKANSQTGVAEGTLQLKGGKPQIQ